LAAEPGRNACCISAMGAEEPVLRRSNQAQGNWSHLSRYDSGFRAAELKYSVLLSFFFQRPAIHLSEVETDLAFGEIVDSKPVLDRNSLLPRAAMAPQSYHNAGGSDPFRAWFDFRATPVTLHPTETHTYRL
jgi:hypothetical protein